MTYQHQCTLMQGTDPNMDYVLNNMGTTMSKQEHGFYDRVGRSVSVPRADKGKPFFDDGYARALWDFRNDDLLLSDDGKTLWVRDVDWSGENRLLSTWHPIAALEAEYKVARGKSNSQWNQQMKVECETKPLRLRRGIKFIDRAYVRDSKGELTIVFPGDDLFKNPYQIEYGEAFDPALVEQANRFLLDITQDRHSAKNLARMFATPLLEPYKHLSYVLFGDGGNGKGIILGALADTHPQLCSSIDTQRLLGARSGGGGGFSQEQESGKLIGALWAFDEDADDVTVSQLTALKKLSTGDSLIARRIQENAITFKPQCTFIIATNATFTSTMTNASARRYVYVRMRDNRQPEDFKQLLAFRREHGAIPFIMASCALWMAEGDNPYEDVSIADPDSATEAEQWLIDCIVNEGYAVSKDNPYRTPAPEHRNSLNKLGLRTSVRRIAGRPVRVLEVTDEQRFKPFRQKAMEQFEKAESNVLPPPNQTIALAAPSDYSFDCDYVPAGRDKVAINWKRLVESDLDTATIPATPVHAVVPNIGYAIIDMDMSKEKKQTDGWTAISLGVGEYGTDGFPRTYLVRTPSGGYHAYYALPAELTGNLKNSVHNNGIPVDIRTERKGYVIGAGSKTDAGDYELVDVPEGGAVPEMSVEMVEWLRRNGYVQNKEKAKPPVFKPKTMFRPETKGEPDMSAIPEGQRNDQLHAWAYGRYKNHLENKLSIEADVYDRGRVSGLRDDEIATLWGSVLRELGE